MTLIRALVVLSLSVGSVAVADPQERFESSFAGAMNFCKQWFLPNSMAREPGFDLDAFLFEMEAGIKRYAKDFRSKEGKDFLQAKEQDENALANACAEKLLKELPK